MDSTEKHQISRRRKGELCDEDLIGENDPSTEIEKIFAKLHLDEEKQRLFKIVAKEWLEQKKQGYLDKQDITKYQTLPVTYQWIESRVKFIDELQKELSSK